MQGVGRRGGLQVRREAVRAEAAHQCLVAAQNVERRGAARPLCDVGLMVAHHDHEAVRGRLDAEVVREDLPVVPDVTEQMFALGPRRGGVDARRGRPRGGGPVQRGRVLDDGRRRSVPGRVRVDGLEHQEEGPIGRLDELLVGHAEAVLVRYDAPSVGGPAIVEVREVEGTVELVGVAHREAGPGPDGGLQGRGGVALLFQHANQMRVARERRPHHLVGRLVLDGGPEQQGGHAEPRQPAEHGGLAVGGRGVPARRPKRIGHLRQEPVVRRPGGAGRREGGPVRLEDDQIQGGGVGPAKSGVLRVRRVRRAVPTTRDRAPQRQGGPHAAHDTLRRREAGGLIRLPIDAAIRQDPYAHERPDDDGRSQDDAPDGRGAEPLVDRADGRRECAGHAAQHDHAGPDSEEVGRRNPPVQKEVHGADHVGGVGVENGVAVQHRDDGGVVRLVHEQEQHAADDEGPRPPGRTPRAGTQGEEDEQPEKIEAEEIVEAKGIGEVVRRVGGMDAEKKVGQLEQRVERQKRDAHRDPRRPGRRGEGRRLSGHGPSMLWR